jgi:hypothetical protein
LYKKFENLDVSQPYWPPLPVAGIALPYLYEYRVSYDTQYRSENEYGKYCDRKGFLPQIIGDRRMVYLPKLSGTEEWIILMV